MCVASFGDVRRPGICGSFAPCQRDALKSRSRVIATFSWQNTKCRHLLDMADELLNYGVGHLEQLPLPHVESVQSRVLS